MENKQDTTMTTPILSRPLCRVMGNPLSIPENLVLE
jgi:hypothetical protein